MGRATMRIAEQGRTKQRRWVLKVSAVGLLALLTACTEPPPDLFQEPEIVPLTLTQTELRDLPLPPAPIPVAVYGFEDQTGQFKPQENVQTLSRAVSQGGAAILIQALEEAGRGGWFTVLERNGLDNLLRERQIIQEMRARYLNERTVNPQALPPLLFAGIILEGGVVGFDSNTLTGGFGARYLGIGGDIEYRQNTITVNLRAVSVKTGEILANVTTSKTLASVGIQGGVFRFVSFDELLEIETGVTTNEPGVTALRRTIEKAVHSLILAGADAGIWAFADTAAAAPLLRNYRAESSIQLTSLDETDVNGVLSAAASEGEIDPFRQGSHGAAASEGEIDPFSQGYHVQLGGAGLALECGAAGADYRIRIRGEGSHSRAPAPPESGSDPSGPLSGCPGSSPGWRPDALGF